MNRLASLKILDKKVLNLFYECDFIGIILCLISFIFTYFYFQNYNYELLNISFFIFKTGLTIKIGSFISAVIIQNNIK